MADKVIVGGARGKERILESYYLFNKPGGRAFLKVESYFCPLAAVSSFTHGCDNAWYSQRRKYNVLGQLNGI